MDLDAIGPLTISPKNLKLRDDITVLMQNTACATNSMVLGIFTT